jgi:DNA-binding GntR family transcriptional regulator
MRTSPRSPARSTGVAKPRNAQSAARPVARQTVAAATLQAIRDNILSGDYREGEQLRQDALAAQLGVSRIPVREALRQLEAEGLVTFHPHRGAVVSSFSIGEIEELFELRAQIETDLLRRAIPHLTDEALEAAEVLLDAFEAAFARNDVAAWGHLNWRFHATLYAPAERPLTIGIVENLHYHADRYARMQLVLTRGEAKADAEHRALLAAARERHVELACQLLNDHILGAGRTLATFLRDQRAREGGEGRERKKANAASGLAATQRE